MPSVVTEKILFVPIQADVDPVTLQVGFARVIPLNATEPKFVTAVAVNVFDPVFAAPYFTHGDVVYLPMAIFTSLPITSDAR